MRERVLTPMLKGLRALTDRAAFPLWEVLLIGLVLALLWAIAASLIRRRARPLIGTLGLLASLAALCLALWLPLTAPALSRTQTPRAAGQVEALCQKLTQQANALSGALGGEAKAETILRQVRTLTGVRVKAARYPELLRLLDAAGIYFPLTGEATVDAGVRALELPFAACHEAAHARGYGREDEANYAAYMDCLKGNVNFRYSGTLYALKYAMDALRDADKEAWLTCARSMNRRVHTDFYSLNGYDNAPKPAGVWPDRFSEAFLRLSRQDGLKSYGGMVDLLLEAPPLP